LQKRILSIGHNFALLRFRNVAIQNAGYQVTTTKETELAVELASKQDFAAVVICSSVPGHLRENIARELRRLRPILSVIVICEEGERDCLKGLAQEVVSAPHPGSQQPVIDAIKRVVDRQEEDQRKTL
jgi:DNA-binding response OmpR family regulator